MRFAGRLVEPYTGDSQMSPGGINSRESFRRRMNQPRAPYSLDPSSLEVTPEMKPPTDYFPGQDLMRDQYIRHNPASGIAQVPLSEALDQIMKDKFMRDLKMREYYTNPDNLPKPYHPRDNPIMPDYPGPLQSVGTGDFV